MHKPVMLHEIIKNLDIKSDNFYIDTTFGLGGHSLEIKKYLNKKGKMLALDKDITKYNLSKHLNNINNNIKLINISFDDFTKISKSYNSKIYDGTLCDLGISRIQLLDEKKGFTYNEGFLDMRLNYKQKIRALDWLNNVKKNDLTDILNIFNNKKFAKEISKKIIKLRSIKKINTSKDIKNIILNKKDIIKLFNIVRIFINNEIKTLKFFLLNSGFLIKKHGKIAFLTFNSMEDKIVKRYINQNNKLLKEKKPSIVELHFNISSRSAILRILQNSIS